MIRSLILGLIFTCSGLVCAQQFAPNGYYIEGNRVFDINGSHVQFKGVNRPSLEWRKDGKFIVRSDFEKMAASCANIVRLPLNQYYWLNDISGYQALVDTIINWCMQEDMAVILDLHRSQKNNINHNPGDIYAHADTLSLDFWYKMATKYKENGKLLFELYNEPHRIQDFQLVDGGINDNRTPFDPSDDWEMAGYQELYDTVRAAGAHNLIIVGGNLWTYDLRYYEDHPIVGYNIMYATHTYPIPGKFSDRWHHWTTMAKDYPIIATEFGPSTTGSTDYLSELMDTLDHYHGHYTAWAWFHFSGSNNIWEDFNPAQGLYDMSFYGAWLFEELESSCGIVLSKSSVFNKDEFDCYPNPTTGLVRLPDKSNFSVSNVQGIELLKGNGHRLDLSPLHEGMYVVHQDDHVYRIIKK